MNNDGKLNKIETDERHERKMRKSMDFKIRFPFISAKQYPRTMKREFDELRKGK